VGALNWHGVVRCFIFVTFAVVSSGCATVTLAPGADQIRVTRVPTDVATCVVVGNVDGAVGSGLALDGMRQLQNQTVGLGGNTVLVTTELPPQKGIAYRCGSGSGQPR
jgi:hypothetical protein